MNLLLNFVRDTLIIMNTYNPKIILPIIWSLIMLTSCDKEQREAQIREKASKEIREDNETDEALREIIKKEDIKEYGLISVIEETEDITVFNKKIANNRLKQTLSEGDKYTIFAPSNEAFNTTNELVQKGHTPDEEMVRFHIVSKDWTAADLRAKIKENDGSLELETLTGKDLEATLMNDKILLVDTRGKSAQVINEDIYASNGTLHIIDNVLIAN